MKIFGDIKKDLQSAKQDIKENKDKAKAEGSLFK